MNHLARAATIRASAQGNRRLSEDALGRRPTVAGAASTNSYRSGEPIRIRTGSSECWGRLIRGAARLCVLQDTGRRRIVDFLLPGDLLEPAACGHGFDLEAVSDGTVMAIYVNRRAERWTAADLDVPRDVHDLSFAVASRFRRQILILGHSTATGKLCAFLLEMQRRCADNQPDTVVLPMSRYDIADYLAISVETVSRCLSALQARKAITLIRKREVKILDRGALEYGFGAPEATARGPHRASLDLVRNAVDVPIASRGRTVFEMRRRPMQATGAGAPSGCPDVRQQRGVEQ